LLKTRIVAAGNLGDASCCSDAGCCNNTHNIELKGISVGGSIFHDVHEKEESSKKSYFPDTTNIMMPMKIFL